jgi:hypothetical protein
MWRVTTVALANADAVGEEDEIALAALGRLGAAGVVLEPQRAVGGHVGMTPGGGMVAEAADGHADMHPLALHADPPASWPPAHDEIGTKSPRLQIGGRPWISARP